MSPAATLRTFVSIDPPASLRHTVARLQSQLRLPSTVRWTPALQIHLTLRFIGNIPAADSAAVANQLRHACAGFPPFSLRARGVGAFPTPRRPRVLWIGLEGDLETLGQLRACVCQQTAAWGEPETQPFQPHLTVARIRPPVPKPLRSLLNNPPSHPLGDWSVTEVHLIQSTLTPQGAIHTLLHRIPL